jgi:hypothetical protein
VPAATARPPTISLRIHPAPASPRDASVVIDDQTMGPLDFVAAHGVALPPGVHHMTVRASGYFPWDRELTASPGSPPVVVEVALSPVPD